MAALNERDLNLRIPGAPGRNALAAVGSATAFTNPRVLFVTTAGTFTFVSLDGTSISADLPVGLFPVYLTKITSIGSGTGVTIEQ